jgi:hypothetical protein
LPDGNKLMKSFYFFLLLALSTLPACSHSHSKTTSLQSRSYAKFVKSSKGNGGQSKAYAKYVKKARADRDKRQEKLVKQRAKLPSPDTMAPSEPRETTEISQGPQAIPSDSGNQ